MSMTYPKRERKEGNFKKTKAKVNPKPTDQRNTYVTEPTALKICIRLLREKLLSKVTC